MQRPCNTHELKILPKYFDDVKNFVKNFEIRKNDRNFAVNDILLLKEWEHGKYTGRETARRIQYIYFGDGTFGLPEGFCVLGLYMNSVNISMTGNNNTQIGYVQNMTL